MGEAGREVAGREIVMAVKKKSVAKKSVVKKAPGPKTIASGDVAAKIASLGDWRARARAHS